MDPTAQSNLDPHSDDMAQLLCDLEGSAEGIERGLAFRLEPQRVRAVLSTLVKERRDLWFVHLLQWLHEIDLEEPPLLSRVPGTNLARIEIVPRCPTVLASLSPNKVEERECLILAGDAASTLARILCEAETSVIYRQAGAKQSLVTNKESFSLFPAEKVSLTSGPWTPGRGLSLELPVEAFRTPGLFGFGPGTVRDMLLRLAGVHGNRPTMKGMRPLHPDWPFKPEPVTSILEWDWESVRPVQACTELDHCAWGAGFSWMVASGSEALASQERFADRTLRNDTIIHRSWSRLPVLACYPAALAAELSSLPSGVATIRASAVLGVATCATQTPQSGHLVPIVRGVPASPVSSLPLGLHIMADASHLRTDASGIKLVQDENFALWHEQVLAWAKQQVEQHYLPHLESMAELGRRGKGGSPPSNRLLKRFRSAVDDLFRPTPTPEQCRARRTTLAGWIFHDS